MYQILDNLKLTRKKRMTHILNEQGGLMWSGPSTGHAIAWMIENDQLEAQLVVGETDYWLRFTPFPI